MPIDRETFENASEDEMEGLSTVDRVLGFLVAHEDRAFKAREIAFQAELDGGAVSTTLSRLQERRLVDHKGTYWAVTTNDARLEGYGGYERATALFNEQFGEERREEWRAHAPDEPHPSPGEDEE